MPDQDSEIENSVLDSQFVAEWPTAGSPVDDESELAELRRALAEAQPRLDAFAALEALAEEQSTTPEAVAIQASIELLEAEQAEVREELERVQVERDEVVAEHGTVVDELAEMLEELESIRADAVRLLGEKAELELKVEALRNDVSASFASPRSSGPSTLDSAQADDEATAFDRFFDADVEEDKARAWMLE